MWHETIKEKYSTKLFSQFLAYFADSPKRQKSVQLKMNDVTGVNDWYYPTSTVMAFERENLLPNHKRVFPQKG